MITALRKPTRLPYEYEKRLSRLQRGPYFWPMLGGWACCLLLLPWLIFSLYANSQLRSALELFTRSEGSCSVVLDGPRVACELRQGAFGPELVRLELETLDIPLLRQLEHGSLGIHAKRGPKHAKAGEVRGKASPLP